MIIKMENLILENLILEDMDQWEEKIYLENLKKSIDK